MHATASVDGMSTAQLRAEVTDALGNLGFAVVQEEPPEFSAKHPIGTAAKPAFGTIVGEAGLRADTTAVKAIRRWDYLMIAVGASGFALVLLLAAAGVVTSRGFPFPALVFFMVAVFGTAHRQSTLAIFESQIVSVQYWGERAPDQGPDPVTAGTSLHFQIRINAGSMSTVNCGGKGRSVRQLRRVNSPEAGLAGVPESILQSIGASLGR
ncbi:MAG: hypothetical protein L3K19_05315 [Thermoplasmata archaeon]|nr:hypothetical protein [Thermoplasmata archaeon]